MGERSRISFFAATRFVVRRSSLTPAVVLAVAFLASGCLYAIHFSSPPKNRALATVSDLGSNVVFVGFVAEDERGVELLNWSFGDSGYYEMRPSGQAQDLPNVGPVKFHLAWKQARRYGVLLRDNQRSWQLSWFTADRIESATGGDAEPAGAKTFTIQLAESTEEPPVRVLRNLGLGDGLEDPTWWGPTAGGERIAPGILRGYLRECLRSHFTAKEHVLNQEFTDAIVDGARVIDFAEDVLSKYSSWTEPERDHWSSLYAAFLDLRSACRKPDRSAALRALEIIRTTLEALLE